MRKFGIGIERQGYLQDEAIDVLSLCDYRMFTSWLDHYEVPHFIRDDGRIEVRIYVIRLYGPLSRFIEHPDAEYETDDYDLWLVDPKLFEVSSFVSRLAGSRSCQPLLEEAFAIWQAGLDCGIFDLSMGVLDLEDGLRRWYAGHFPSIAALLIDVDRKEHGCGYDDLLDDGVALEEIPSRLSLVGRDGYWFYKRQLASST